MTPESSREHHFKTITFFCSETFVCVSGKGLTIPIHALTSMVNVKDVVNGILMYIYMYMCVI